MKFEIELEFVKAHSTTNEYDERINLPDCIYFHIDPKNHTDYGLRKSIIKQLKSLSGFYDLGYYYGNRRYCISADNSAAVLNTLKNITLQHGDECYIQKHIFDSLLQDLFDSNYFSASQTTEFRSSISTEYTLEAMRNIAQASKDANVALKVAFQYKTNKDDTSALRWLVAAWFYDNGHEFFESLDNIREFVNGMNSIEIAFLFADKEYSKKLIWLIDVIVNSPSIQEASLNDNKIYYLEEYFSYFLKKAKFLKKLTIMRTSGDPSSKESFINTAKLLAEGLRNNTCLVELDLSYQMLGDKALMIILDALKQNPSNKLEKLNLKRNNIGENGARALLNYMQGNNTLKWVYLYKNNQNSKVSMELMDAIDEVSRQKQSMSRLQPVKKRDTDSRIAIEDESIKDVHTAQSPTFWEEILDSAGSAAAHGAVRGAGKVAGHLMKRRGYSNRAATITDQFTYHGLYFTWRLGKNLWTNPEAGWGAVSTAITDTSMLAALNLGLWGGEKLLGFVGRELSQSGYTNIGYAVTKFSSWAPQLTFLYQAGVNGPHTAISSLVAGVSVSTAVEIGGKAIVDCTISEKRSTLKLP